MVYEALVRRAHEQSNRSLVDLPDLATWQAALPARRQQWLDLLGLDPLPPRTDLRPEITGVLDRGDHVIEKLHYQPVPDCRLPANLYRPAGDVTGLPAVIYVCGHGSTGKAWYQAHARWFARHGYVCLILDTIEIGEGVSTHHGTYTEGWWHWYSQGYSPAAVEVWCAMRGADYLATRPEVDADRMGITGNSGGGAISWFTGAADERFKVVAPVCQTGTMAQQIGDRTIDGHCDCTTWVNHLGWDWPDVGALIAPRPLFVGSATEDGIWRPWSNREIFLRLRKLYRLYDLEALFAVVEDTTPHGYSPPIRAGLFGWFERHLKGTAQPTTDDLDDDQLPPEDLRAFPSGRPPEGDRLKDIHDFFLPVAAPPTITDRVDLEEHRDQAVAKLRSLTFRQLPTCRETPAYNAAPRGQSGQRCLSYRFATEPGLDLQAWLLAPEPGQGRVPVLVAPVRAAARSGFMGQGTGLSGVAPDLAQASIEVRGTADTSVGPGLEWTLRRSYPLLGQSLPERRTLDLLRGIDVLRDQPNVGPVAVFGTQETAPLAIYAALLEPAITEVVLLDPVTTHWHGGPEFCHVLKVGDLPQNLACLFPRPITFIGAVPEAYAWTQAAYAAAGEPALVRSVARVAAWRPAGGS